jgi:hypothetical protein
MNTRLFYILLIGLIVSLNIYLFVSAPPPLESSISVKKRFAINDIFEQLALENDATRTLYTKAIVGAGKKQGLSFDERWAEQDVHAGPLPALFLRGISNDISETEVPLDLFLGSDFPIESSNKFKGIQAEKFAQMRLDKKSKFFFDEITGKHIAMFPDYASAMPCVTCHNEHERTSKTDWVLGDIMGATTWAYPEDSLSTDDALKLIAAYRRGVKNTYLQYLKKFDATDLNSKPIIGNKWPSQGNFLPDYETFSDSVQKLVSPAILSTVLKSIYVKN